MPNWKTFPLNQALIGFLPAFVTRIERGGATKLDIDVQRLRVALTPVRSHENVYQWLRKGTVSPSNAKALCEVANAEPNLAMLKAAGREPPAIGDFLPFFDFD